ncbi:MAG: alkaline phosphatase family protein [Desulfurococcales archaeon]|nr:alkaline phosphatase family protein [Desulfurococcales archaeon]
MKTTAVLGLDALPYWYIGKLREWGQTPHLNKLLENAGALECIPPITPSSWPSIMTGVNPGKHGVFSFHHVDRASRQRRLVSSLDLEHPRVHEILSFNGIENIMVNPIPDYPIIPVKKSVIISNMFFTPRPSSHPREYYERYFRGVEGLGEGNYKEFIVKYVGAIEDMLVEDNGRHGFVWLTLNFPDHEFHKNPRLLDNPAVSAEVWRGIDRLAKYLLDNFDNVFLVSDHGFRFFNFRVSINDILYNHGFVVLAKKDEEVALHDALAQQKGIRTRRVRVPAKLYRLVARLGLEPQARRVFRFVARLYSRLTGGELVPRTGMPIDYHRSKAYMPESGMYGVYIFDDDVGRDEVYRILREYKGLRIWKTEELFSGPFTGRGPDIVVVGDHERGYSLGPARVVGTIYVKTKYHTHDLWGVFGARTSDGFLEESIRGGLFRNTIVAPLVLCSTGVPVSRHSDDLELIEKMCPGRVETAVYTGKFQVVKSIFKARQKITSRKRMVNS